MSIELPLSGGYDWVRDEALPQLSSDALAWINDHVCSPFHAEAFRFADQNGHPYRVICTPLLHNVVTLMTRVHFTIRFDNPRHATLFKLLMDPVE